MLRDGEVFITKWIGDRGDFVGFNKNHTLVQDKMSIDTSDLLFVQVLIRPDRKLEFTNKINDIFGIKINKIEYYDNFYNLRTQSQITVMDVVQGNIKGLLVLIHLKCEHDLLGLDIFLINNKHYFHIYDIHFSDSMIQRFFEMKKRNDINFLKYGVLKDSKFVSSDKLPAHRVCSFDIETVSGDMTCIANGAGLYDKIVAVSFVIGLLFDETGSFELESETCFILSPSDHLTNLDLGDPKSKRKHILFYKEIDLLKAVCNFLQNELDTPFLIGYNILGFDFPFIFNRMFILGLTNSYYSIKEVNRIITGLQYALPCCDKFQIVDVMYYLKRMHPNDFSSFSLNNVALEVLNKSKLNMSFKDLKTFYESKTPQSSFLQKISDYVMYDSILTLEVYVAKKIHLSLFPLMGVCFSDSIDYMSKATSKIITCFQKIIYPSQGMCLNREINNEIDISNKKTGDMFDSIGNKQYRGATVLKTSRAVYANQLLHVVDFSSLYPSLIREYNISKNYVISDFDPSLYTEDVVRDFLNKTNKMESFYTMKRKYFKSPLSVVVEYLIYQRKIAKNTYLSNTFKLIANSLYGLLASQNRTMRHIQSAALVTSYGRKMHSLIKNYIEEKLFCKVVAGDTDSFFVLLPENYQGNIAESLNMYIRNVLGLETISLTLDYEATTTIFLAEKKQYLMKLKNNTIKVVGLAKRLRPTRKLQVKTFLTLLLDIIENQFSCRSNFNQSFENLIKTFFTSLLKDTPDEDYMFVCNAKPFYEYVNLSSFNAVCSYRKSLIGIDETFATTGELFLSYVLPIGQLDYSKRKKRDSVEFWNRISEANLQIDKVEYLKKLFNFVPNMERYILKTNSVFNKFLDMIRKNEIEKNIITQKQWMNLWKPKKLVRHCTIIYYYDELFKDLSDYNIHFWDERDIKSSFHTIINVGLCGALTSVNNETFHVKQLQLFLESHKKIKKLNVLLLPTKTSSFSVCSNDSLIWFLDILYNKPDHFHAESNHHATPDGRMFIVSENHVTIYSA